ncbi:MAG: DUF512 domain-containing protein [Peptococcaceae bacterium]|nr:DUF512 domain-containing protein [Peptococcaceae bacterium]
MNEGYVKSLILRTIQEANILPVTSSCNLGCIFCSHRMNPPGISVVRLPQRTTEEIIATIDLLDPARPVIIGESATPIIEGEPFAYPQFPDILVALRHKFPQTPIHITTNGSYLDRRTVKFLAELKPLLLYLSLNSADPEQRRLLMRDAHAHRAIEGAALLGAYNVEFHGSVVAMPHITGWHDLQRTIEYLVVCGAQTVRLFLPGYTRYAPPNLHFKDGLWSEIRAFVDKIRCDFDTPLVVEPPLVDNLTPVIRGVIRETPAARAGLQAGDVILSVDNEVPASRVEAYRRLKNSTGPLVEYRRRGLHHRVRLDKTSGTASGAVFDYDIDPVMLDDIRNSLDENTLLAASLLGIPVLRKALETEIYEDRVRLCPVPNRWFGGSIACAGLLTVQDILAAVRGYLTDKRGWQPKKLLVPAAPFDYRGRDLRGVSYLDLQQACDLPVKVVGW